MLRLLLRMLITALLLDSAAASSLAGDWPQFRGPARDGRSAETGLLKSWPKEGPHLLWTLKEAGVGYSGPAVVGKRLVTMGMDEAGEFVACFSVEDGRRLWKTPNGKRYENGFGDGPRATPTVDGDRVFCLGAHGDLCCLGLESGVEVWRLNILEAFEGQNIQWGISESPLVEGGLVIVTPGGKKATVAALDKATGKPAWVSRNPSHAGPEEAGYASCISVSNPSGRQIATFTSKGAYAARASDGKFMWSYAKVANGTANVATPLQHGGKLFFSSDYGTGCALLRLGADGVATEEYFTRNMKNHHGGLILHDGHVYGADGGHLACVEWESGQQKWKDRSVGKASVTFAEGLLYALGEEGTMGLVRAVPTGYQEISRFKLPELSERLTWTYPVIADGRLYLRDQSVIRCYDVKAK